MDWCREVEEYLRKGYDDNRVKDTMLSSMEGQAYVNFRSCDEGRNHTPAQILNLQRLRNLPGPKCPDVRFETGDE